MDEREPSEARKIWSAIAVAIFCVAIWFLINTISAPPPPPKTELPAPPAEKSTR
jgi:hypothetical protein